MAQTITDSNSMHSKFEGLKNNALYNVPNGYSANDPRAFSIG